MSEASGLQAELSWIESAVDKSAEAYFNKFELCVRRTAHQRYKSLISSDLTNLSEVTKKALKDDFVRWKTSRGVEFWLDRRTHLSTMRTAGSLAEAAEPYVEASFKRNISRMEPTDHKEEFSHAGQKHPRDYSNDAAQTKPPRHRASMSEGCLDDGNDLNEVLPGDGPSTQPSFGLAEDKIATPDWPQTAVLNQDDATPRPRNSPIIMLPEGPDRRQLRRISFGRNLAVNDLRPPGYSSSPCDDGTRALLGADLSSSDPDDSNFSTRGLYESTSRVYTWNYLEGSGRFDSNVGTVWKHKEVIISQDLMEFRDRVVLENGGLLHPHQKLVINFIFLIEGEHRAKGLHLEIDDVPWEAMCEATRDHVDRLPKETVDQALQWAQFLMRESPDAVKSLLNSTPPNDPSLNSILNLMVVSGHLWDSEPTNEDSFLKAWLGPFLNTYFGSNTFMKSAWTHTQEETLNVDFSRLVPDFATVTATLQGELSLVLLEGKAESNRVFQIWDDKTKLGQEMKLALDSILLLSPGDDVCVVGIHVKKPLIEFFSMKIHSEGCYIMHRFATCHIPTDHENMVSLVSMMEAFHHAAAKVTTTLSAIRRVRVRPSPTPKVPFSWLRPSYSKPRRKLVRDG
ncbi:MAG: hypothetical protein J3Q66DRAFT_345451 [Benniella sp.]|nr:MAG: hypothetical protein J3Q66DRAFT_345451 [Benniella sp.]